MIISCRAFDMMGLDAKSGILPYALPGFGSGSQTRGNSAALGVSDRAGRLSVTEYADRLDSWMTRRDDLERKDHG